MAWDAAALPAACLGSCVWDLQVLSPEMLGVTETTLIYPEFPLNEPQCWELWEV